MYKLFSKITEQGIEEKIENKIKFESFDKNLTYDIHVEYYNFDLVTDVLNEDVSYEIKKEHYSFIRKIRQMFEKYEVKVNKFLLMGTIADIGENEIEISVLKSKETKKKNIVWPCKEIFLFEDHKNKLDILLFNNQISEEDYESNLEILKDELNIYEDEEFKYLN